MHYGDFVPRFRDPRAWGEWGTGGGPVISFRLLGSSWYGELPVVLAHVGLMGAPCGLPAVSAPRAPHVGSMGAPCGLPAALAPNDVHGSSMWTPCRGRPIWASCGFTAVWAISRCLLLFPGGVHCRGPALGAMKTEHFEATKIENDQKTNFVLANFVIKAILPLRNV